MISGEVILSVQRRQKLADDQRRGDSVCIKKILIYLKNSTFTSFKIAVGTLIDVRNEATKQLLKIR